MEPFTSRAGRTWAARDNGGLEQATARPVTGAQATGAGGSPAAGKVAHLHLIGPMRLIDPQGRDCTPRSGILQALLAILALSPHGTKMRAKLQDLLWSESDQEHGSQSLRTALSRLRRELSGLPVELLETDNLAVRLDVAKLWIDVFEYSQPGNAQALRQTYGAEIPDLLEGLNVRSSCGEELEDWLRQERSHWADRLEALRDREADAQPASFDAGAEAAASALDDAILRAAISSARPGLGVGLLPPIVCTESQQAAYLGDAFLDSIATALRDFMLAEIYDYRDTAEVFPPVSGGSGPPILLRAKVYEEREELMLTLLAYRCCQQRLLWQWTVHIPPGESRARSVLFFVNEAVDRVCETLATTCRDPASSNTPYHALNTMFRLDGASSLEAARVMLEQAYQDSGEPVHLSLLAYLNTFKVGEHWMCYDDRVRTETRELVDAVLAEHPFNSLTLALTGHACGYVLHDRETAVDLLERATRMDPSPAICWDHLALNYLYSGRTEDALRASEMAIRLGSFSPLRFTYDTTMCMICTIRGEYERAVKFGERALARRPNFGAALRYTAISLGHLGERDAAARLVGRIRSMAPDFSSDWVANNRLAIADQQAKAALLIGLQKAGA